MENVREPEVVDEEKLQVYREYWQRLKKITIIWMLLWTIPAFWMHLPIEYTSKIKILGGIPLHWFNAGFLAVIIGILLIFAYAYVMGKVDESLLGR